MPSPAILYSYYASSQADIEGVGQLRRHQGSGARCRDRRHGTDAATKEEFLDATQAFDRVLMQQRYFIPWSRRPAFNSAWWDRFGIPQHPPRYFTLLADTNNARPWPILTWWDSRKWREQRGHAMIRYIATRLLLMLPTLLGVLTVTFVLVQMRPGRTGRAGHFADPRAPGAIWTRPRTRSQADRGHQEALRLRQATARALPRDGRQLRALRVRHQLPGQQGCLGADQGEAAGLRQPRRLVISCLLSALDSAGRGQGGARRLPVRCAVVARRARRLCASGLRARRVPHRALLRRNVSSTGSRCAASPPTTGRSSRGRRASATTSGTSHCR